MSEENIAVVRRTFEEVWSQGNIDLVDELMSEDFLDHDAIMGDQDREALKQAVAGYREAFPDLEIRIDDIFAAGDKVVTRWTADGTFEKEYMGQEPTGERGTPVEGIGIDRLEDGKIVEAWGQWQVLTFMQNIGLVPSQEPATA